MNDTSMHLALFVYCLTGGGAQRRTITLANAFAARGHRVDLVVVSSPESQTANLRPDVRVVPLDSGWRRRVVRLNRHINVRGLLTAAATPVLVRYLRHERPDILLSAANHVNLVSLWAWRLSGTRAPLVLRASNHPSGNLRQWPAGQPLSRTSVGRLPAPLCPWGEEVTAVSGGVAADLVKLTWMPRERITTICNPVVTPEIERDAQATLDYPWFAPGSPPVILGVGKLKIQKDFPNLVRAFARVRRAVPVRLVILGEGGERKKLERLSRELGVAADVVLPGSVENPFAWMSKASVFGLSSAWEGLPGVLIEAMACGCPVVSTDCPSGPAEILEDGKFGPLVPVGDDAALAQAILSVLRRPPDRDRLRARAAAFSVEPAVDRYLEVLRAQIRGRQFSAAAPPRGGRE